jgi:hypothetical protein
MNARLASPSFCSASSSSLRSKYKAVYTAYMNCVRALSEASKSGELPTGDILRAEEKAMDEFLAARRELLDALLEHSKRA